MPFYNIGERKLRPGVYIRTVNRSAQNPIPIQKIPEPQPGPEPVPQGNAVLISPEGVMYTRGQGLTVELGSDGGYVLTFENGSGITATVSGNTLEILNPGS